MKFIGYILIALFCLGIIAMSGFAAGKINFDADQPALPGEIVVKFNPGVIQSQIMQIDGAIQTSEQSVNAVLNQLRIDMMKPVFRSKKPSLSSIYRLRFKAPIAIFDALNQLAQNPNVEWVEPNYIYEISATPNDPAFLSHDDYWPSDQWGLIRIQADLAWDITQGSDEIVIAVIDTGVDYNHPDLGHPDLTPDYEPGGQDKIWRNLNEIPGNGLDDDGNDLVDDYIGWDFVTIPPAYVYPGEDPGELIDPGPPEVWVGDNDPMDFYGHGTHCSGIAGASTNNGIGVAGTAWNCKIMAIRAGYKTASGGGSLAGTDIVASLEYAADQGADVISMSWGGSYSGDIRDAIIYAYNAGCVLVAAAGNNNSSNLYYPAAYSSTDPYYDVIGVAASIEDDDGRAYFSNYGSWVDIAAPGLDILNIRFDDTYYWWNGTSMAAPFVAGAAGLLLSYNPALTIEEVKTILLNNGDNIYWAVGGPDKRLNIYKSLLAMEPAAPTNLAATPASSEQIDLIWNDVDGETGYKIERKEAGGSFSQIDTVGANVTSYPDTGLDYNTTYTYRVCAYNVNGDSDWSNEDSATTNFPSHEFVFAAYWNLISCPGNPVNDNFAIMFQGPIAAGIMNPDVFVWNSSEGKFEIAPTCDFGVSYWVYTLESCSATVDYKPLYSMDRSLNPYWEMIGSLADSVPWADRVCDPSEVVNPTLFGWNAETQQFTDAGNMEPGHGYYSNQIEFATLNIACSSAPAAPRRGIRSPVETVPGWESMVTVKSGKYNKELLFGMHPSASSGFDVLFDKPIPPSPATSEDNEELKKIGRDIDNGILVADWEIDDPHFPLLSTSCVGDDDLLVWSLLADLPQTGLLKFKWLPEGYECFVWEGDGQAVKVWTEKTVRLSAGEHKVSMVLEKVNKPRKTEVLANYPNPFNPETWIPYKLARDSDVLLIIYDVSGREIRRLHMGNRPAGEYLDKSRAIYWDGKNKAGEAVSSGIYFYSLKTADAFQTRKLVIVR